MTESRERRSFTPEYRVEAARLVIETGRPIARVARELGLGEQLLGRWVRRERARQVDEPTGELSPDERVELRVLRRQQRGVAQGQRVFGKSSRLACVEASTCERYELMALEKANCEITRMARLLGVSRSGYYAWASRQGAVGPMAVRRDELDARVSRFHSASDGVYGAPRIAADLRVEGWRVNVKTVAASMRRQGLAGISPRAWHPVTTIPGLSRHRIPDLVQRCWDTGELNRVWISDITYLRTGEGWLYLCAVRDGCSRRVLGWAMDSRQDTALVERALTMAVTLRGHLPADVVFHTDRGTQFTSTQLHQVCQRVGVRQSVGRTGVCFDNAMAESFWSTLKTEYYARHTWPTRTHATQAIVQWIEVVYNRRRRHSKIGNIPPIQFEQTYQSINAIKQAA